MSDLSGPELDYAVAKVVELDCFKVRDGGRVADIRVYIDPERERRNDLRRSVTYNPSTNWSQLGPLIDKYDIVFYYETCGGEPELVVCMEDGECRFPKGTDKKVAICRAVVASK